MPRVGGTSRVLRSHRRSPALIRIPDCRCPRCIRGRRATIYDLYDVLVIDSLAIGQDGQLHGTLGTIRLCCRDGISISSRLYLGRNKTLMELLLSGRTQLYPVSFSGHKKHFRRRYSRGGIREVLYLFGGHHEEDQLPVLAYKKTQSGHADIGFLLLSWYWCGQSVCEAADMGVSASTFKRFWI
ncbi:10259_t:CDS:1, partial [Paraglomus occultum]